MAPGPSVLWLKALSIKILSKVSLGSRQKPKSPSSTSITLVDSWSFEDGIHSLDEKELTFKVDLEPDMWREILSYCEVTDILHVGMTCRSLASITEDHKVWYFALLRIAHNRRLPHLNFRIKSLSSTILRQKAITSAQLDHISRGLDTRPFPYTTTTLSLPVSMVWAISFLPDGEWLVVLCRKAGEDGVMLCKASNPLGQPSAYATFPDWNLTNMCIFTSDQGKLLLLLRSDRPGATRLVVYLIHPLDIFPGLETVWTIQVPEIENCAALGNYIVHGWIDRRSARPRHLVQVSKLETCYRRLAGYCVMEIKQWEVGMRPLSYGLRFTDSQITVVVSNMELVAAYKVPFTALALNPCEPRVVTPFWCFPCAHMRPRAVYLVPSLPAVDTPSVVILYGTRCLFITPSFDADPLQRHPTYFSTYTYPRELKRPMLLGPHRAFWDLGRGRVGIGMLPTPTTPAFYENGVWDMTGIHAPEANLVNDVHPLGPAGLCNSKVARAAWDEESGSLALCPRADPSLVILVKLTS